MADKYQTVSYLVGLHTLLEAQSKGQTSVLSSVLATEYTKNWELLKQIVKKEHEDEAGKS